MEQDAQVLNEILAGLRGKVKLNENALIELQET